MGHRLGAVLRALILDGGGSPTTLTILSDETLDVTYTIRVYPPTTDVTGSITLDGVSYGYTIRPCNVSTSGTGSYYWDLRLDIFIIVDQLDADRLPVIRQRYAAGATIGARTALPSGTSTLTDITVTTLTYVPGEFKVPQHHEIRTRKRQRCRRHQRHRFRLPGASRTPIMDAAFQIVSTRRSPKTPPKPCV